MHANSSKDLSIEELKLLGEAIDSSPSPLTLYDNNHNIIYANQTSRELWPELHVELSKGVGLQKAAIEASKVIFPQAPEAVLKQATDYVIKTFNSPEAHEMRASNGRWITLTHHQIADKAIAGIGVEITELKKQEKILKQAKQAQENLIEVLEHSLLVVDDDGIVASYNPTYMEYCNSLGFEVAKGMHIKDLSWKFIEALHENPSKRGFDIEFDEFYTTRFGKEGSWEDEYSLPDGRHVLCHQTYRKLVGNIITTTDITDVKNAQLKAESAERSKSEFLANMSHEIRTPMNGVMGMAQLLMLSDLGEKEKKFVKVIERSGEALLTIINDILDFSKVEAGRIVLEPEPFNLPDSIEDVIGLLSVAAAEKGIELLLHIEPGMPETYLGDIGRFRQVMTNLIGNAVKFTDEGHVIIQLKGKSAEDKTDIDISIMDTGIGIPKEKIENIFDKFNQADGTTTRKYEGTGLGLSIAKQLINLMGGDISVESEIDKGSHFKIQLSLPTIQKKRDPRIKKSDLRRAKILIIDDNPTSCKILREQFACWDCKSVAVQTVDKGILALEIAGQNKIKFDLIVLDYQMRNETGEDFIDKIQAHQKFLNIPIIMLNSVFEMGLEQRMIDKGVRTCLNKPYNKKRLYEAVKNLLGKSKQTDARTSDLRKDVTPTAPSKSAETEDTPDNSTLSNPIPEPQIDVLVAEDNETNSLYIKYVLEGLGVSFKIVDNGKLAVEQFKTLNPRIILMDISMPILNGYQATETIREIERRNALTPTPIFAVTAHALTDDKDKCLNAGMDGYITKPLPMASVKNILIDKGIISGEPGDKHTGSDTDLNKAVEAASALKLSPETSQR